MNLRRLNSVHHKSRIIRIGSSCALEGTAPVEGQVFRRKVGILFRQRLGVALDLVVERLEIDLGRSARADVAVIDHRIARGHLVALGLQQL